MEGAGHTVLDTAVNTDASFAYAPWEDMTWVPSDLTMTLLPTRSSETWQVKVDADKAARQSSAESYCDTFFSAVQSVCTSINSNLYNSLRFDCAQTIVETGRNASGVPYMLAYVEICDWVKSGSLNLPSTSLCTGFSFPWLETLCDGCQFGYKTADGTCVCYTGRCMVLSHVFMSVFN